MNIDERSDCVVCVVLYWTSSSATSTYRVRIASEKLRRGDHRVRLTVVANGKRTILSLTARRL